MKTFTQGKSVYTILKEDNSVVWMKKVGSKVLHVGKKHQGKIINIDRLNKVYV